MRQKRMFDWAQAEQDDLSRMWLAIPVVFGCGAVILYGLIELLLWILK